MEVVLAHHAGFCKGVTRALTMLLEEIQEDPHEPIHTFGPLIHNPEVIEYLRAKHITVITDVHDITGGKVAIRAHGVSPDIREDIQRRCQRLVDATCPDVMKVQSLVKNFAAQGYQVVIVGDKGHAEVAGLLGFAQGKGIVIQQIQDLDGILWDRKIAVVAQTTQEKHFFEQIVSLIKKQASGSEIIVHNTICPSTESRQSEIKELAKKVEAILVIGGKNSANTQRLYHVAQETGLPTFYIESPHELKTLPLKSIHSIGVTAGASTPGWTIKQVVMLLQGLS